MNKRILTLLPIIGILIISGILCIYCYFQTETVTNYSTGVRKSATLEMVNDQVAINNKLSKIANNKRYTFDEPYIEVNPYKISPLSGIIIFTTNESVSVDVYVNDVFVTKMEETKTHIVPIYGLYEDTENSVKLVINGEERIYKLQTEKSDLEYPLEVETKSLTLNNEELYFTVASYKTYLTAWDIDGHLRFYLTVDNRMDVEWLSNGHFLIGTSEGQFAENFCSFVEMDYLGKIYNYYTPENGYSFEFQLLSNGNYMLAGGDKPVYVTEQIVYEMDPKSGEKVSEVNIAEVIKNIDPNFDVNYLGQKAIRNAFYYNEVTDELLLSFRGWDAVISLNYKDKRLNWVFTDPTNELFANEVWREYLVELSSGRYPMGQHSVILTSDGNVGIFNNGYNRLHGFENGGNDLVSYYKTNYSSAEVYSIQDKKARLIFSYDGGRKYFSHQYGSIRELGNGNYLIDFGYNLKNEYRYTDTGKLSEAEQGPDNIYTQVVEVNKYGNVVFKARSEEGKFRVFKHNLYSETTSNVSLNELSIFNKVKEDELVESSYKKMDLDTASDWIYTIDFTKNTLKTNYSIQESDNIDLCFVNKTGKIYILNYKNKDISQLNRIFNANLPNGEYALYIDLNGNLYKTGLVYRF